MTVPATTGSAELIAGLNDLLQLDHDAVGAYSLAIERIRNEEHKQTLIRFRGEHQQHIADLTRLIRDHGGAPVPLPHLPSGAFKLAVQAAGALGGDRELLLAFKSNEGQVRDKYRRYVDRPHGPDVAEVLRRNANDEERHYQWVADVLEKLGAGPGTQIGRLQQGFETVHGRSADVMEGVERRLMQAAEGVRQGSSGVVGDLGRWAREAPLQAAAAVVAAAILLRRILK